MRKRKKKKSTAQKVWKVASHPVTVSLALSAAFSLFPGLREYALARTIKDIYDIKNF